MNNELDKIDYWVSGPTFKDYNVKAHNIFEACAKAIRFHKPKSLAIAIHAWGGGIKREDYVMIGIEHLIENYNLGNNYVPAKDERTKEELRPKWYKRLFK